MGRRAYRAVCARTGGIYKSFQIGGIRRRALLLAVMASRCLEPQARVCKSTFGVTLR